MTAVHVLDTGVHLLHYVQFTVVSGRRWSDHIVVCFPNVHPGRRPESASLLLLMNFTSIGPARAVGRRFYLDNSLLVTAIIIPTNQHHIHSLACDLQGVVVTLC